MKFKLKYLALSTSLLVTSAVAMADTAPASTDASTAAPGAAAALNAQQPATNTNSCDAFKQQSGVVTLDSGLAYKVLKKGNGPLPGPNSTYTVNYEGKLLNGTVFDSSFARNQPFVVQNLQQVIPGWQQALPMMRPGAVWQVCIPSDLAYGAQGAGGVIPPNSPLIFKIQMISAKS